MSEKEVKARVIEKTNKIEIVVLDYDLAEKLYEKLDDYEIIIDTDVPDRSILVIKFHLKNDKDIEKDAEYLAEIFSQ
jgi:DNA-directed RNA polymerase beta subunit